MDAAPWMLNSFLCVLWITLDFFKCDLHTDLETILDPVSMVHWICTYSNLAYSLFVDISPHFLFRHWKGRQTWQWIVFVVASLLQISCKAKRGGTGVCYFNIGSTLSLPDVTNCVCVHTTHSIAERKSQCVFLYTHFSHTHPFCYYKMKKWNHRKINVLTSKKLPACSRISWFESGLFLQ